MFENITNFFKKIGKKENGASASSKDAAKERLHLVLMQDRANVSADFLELMKQEIIDVIKKYIDVDESAIDVRLTNKENEDGTNGAPALYANIPIINIKNDARKVEVKEENKEEANKEETKSEEVEEKIENTDEDVEKEKETENEQDEVEEKEDSSEEAKQARAERIIEEVVEKLETINVEETKEEIKSE